MCQPPLNITNPVTFTRGNVVNKSSDGDVTRFEVRPATWNKFCTIAPSGAPFCTRSFYIMNQAGAFSSGFQTLCLLVMMGSVPLFWKFTWMKTRLHSTSQQSDAVTCHFFLLVFIATQTRVNNASAAASRLGCSALQRRNAADPSGTLGDEIT